VATLAQRSASVDTPELAVPDPDALRRLLATYQRLIEAAGARRSIVALGTERFAIEHVRQALSALERRFNAHAALSDNGAPETEDSRERVRQSLASLPPPQSRLRVLLLTALVLVVARPVVGLAGDVSWAAVLGRESRQVSGGGTAEATQELANAITRVSDLSFGNLSRAVDIVLITNLLTTSVVALVFGAAAYLVLRPLAGGAIAFRMLHTGTQSRWPWYRSEPVRVRDDESAVFDAAGMRAPGDPKLDLAVKACIAVPLLLTAVAWWELFLSAEISGHGSNSFYQVFDDDRALAVEVLQRDPVDFVIAVVLGLYAALRLSWLGAEWARRGATSRARAVSAIAAVGGLALVFGLLSLRDTKPPSIVLLSPPITPVASDPFAIAPAKERPAARVLAVCDEPCTISHAWGEFENGDRSEVFLESDPTTSLPPAFWPTVEANVPSYETTRGLVGMRSSAHVQTVEIHLDKRLARAVKATEFPWFEFEVEDDAGRRKRVILSWNPY
jgi:hypothetical protein